MTVSHTRTAVITFEPGVAALPYMVGLHGAIRRGRFQVRATVGGKFGGPLTVPLVGNVAMLIQGARTKRILQSRRAQRRR